MKRLLLIILMALSSSVFAADLSEADIKRWLTAFPQLNSYLNQHQGLVKQYAREKHQISGNMMQLGEYSTDELANITVAALKSNGLESELASLSKQLGYKNSNHALSDTFKIVRTAMSVQFSAQAAMLQKELANYKAQMAELEKNTALSAEQKQVMLNQFKQGQAYIESMLNTGEQTRPEDISVLQPYLPQIMQMMQQAQ